MFDQLNITSPKQRRGSRVGWDMFFPYYAGYPAAFARSLMASTGLPQGATVLDPWNGSGTTTQVASKLGLNAIGCDINPVMVIVARARCLMPADGDSIEPIAKKVIESCATVGGSTLPDDPLMSWFDAATTLTIRDIERGIRAHLLGGATLRDDGTHFESMSSLAATFYVALFLTCRSLVSAFQSSNPTWLRRRRATENAVSLARHDILTSFGSKLNSMSAQLALARAEPTLSLGEPGQIRTRLLDSAALTLEPDSIDFLLTSPPYCTRIDYTAATRVELSVIAPLLSETAHDLSRRMIGSIRVPTAEIGVDDAWGPTCRAFLNEVRNHPSKASGGYYLKTHLDYFFKLGQSLKSIKRSLKKNATAVFVVQDSYYKDVHNDLPKIVTEMAEASGYSFAGSKSFHLKHSMSGVNPYTRIYKRKPSVTETVLCLERRA